MNQSLGTVAAIGAGALAFAAGFLVLNQNARNNVPATTSEAGPANPDPAPPEPPKPVAPAVAPPPTKPAPPATPIVKRWHLGGRPWKPDERRRVYVDPNDFRAVTQTDSEIVCWNLNNGSRLQTFRPEGKGMYVSPDAKVVATVTQDGRRVVMREASTGSLIGTYEPRGGGEILLHEHEPAFTPAGDFLCLCVKEKTKNAREAIAAVSMRTGVGRIVDLPRDWFDTTGHQWRILMPLPSRNVFLRTLVAHPCCVMNLRDGINTRVESLSIGPDSRPGSRSCKLSPDGRYLLARAPSQLRIIDWKADEIVLKHNMPLLTDDWFTPDSKRFLSLRVPPRPLDSIAPHGWLQLCSFEQIIANDVDRSPRARLLGEFTMDHHELAGVADLAFLRGGKQMLILDRGSSAAIVDFEAAFREPPLPPGPRPTSPESLPLR